ncbi:MAG: hypothetical protein F9K23_16245 [Bacteroidetes bacterium]|nr:MAG: hypothetical protein F9K23_16245 [Bacteroidota bacterium]
MTSIKTTGKLLLRKGIVYILLLANIAAYIATDNFFESRPVASEQEEKKDLVSNLYTGWKVIDWSFSLIDYFRNVGESKK